MQYTVEENVASKHYLYNCPENFHRTMIFQKYQFKKVDTVFIPSLDVEYFGGFTGYTLNRHDGERKLRGWEDNPTSFTVVGPKGLQNIVNLMESILFKPHLTINVVEIPEDLTATHNRPWEELSYIEALGRVAYKDELTTVVPLRAESTTPGRQPVYSYLTLPA